MTELSGTLDGIGLQPLLAFLGGLNKSGNLAVEDEHWMGTLALADGQVVGARFGHEQGLDALDAIFFVLQHGRFQFSASETCEVNLVMEPGAFVGHLEALGREVARLALIVPSLAAVPRSVDATDDGEVTLGRRTLRLLLALDGRRTVAEYAKQRGVLATLRELAELTQLGLVTNDPTMAAADPNGAVAAEPAAVADPSPASAGDHGQADGSPPARRLSADLQARAAEQRRRAPEPDPKTARPAEPPQPAVSSNGRRFWR